MGPRLSFLLVTGFFVTMNVLLWRSEFGGHQGGGSAVPVETVWHKMMVAPDNSRLEIRHHGKKIGYGTWTPSVVQEAAVGKAAPEEVPPEGMIREPSSYNIDFSGNFSIDTVTRLRFAFDLRLAPNHQWQQLSLHFGMRPSYWDLSASAAAQTVKFTSDDETGRSEQSFKFSELQNPDKLFRLVGWPLSSGIFSALGLPGNPTQAGPLGLGLRWDARNDWLTIGRERMRVYRLQGRLFERFQMILFISLEGEILRVEMPDEIVLVNDQLAILQ